MPIYSDPSVGAILETPRRITLGSVLVLVGGLIAIGGAGYMYYQVGTTNKKVAAVQADVATKQAELSQLKVYANQADTYKATAVDLHALFDGQKRWEAVLDAIGSHLYKHVAVSSIQVTDTGSMTLSGTTPTYADYAQLYASLTDAAGQKAFVNVRPTSISKVLSKSTSTDPKVLSSLPFQVGFIFTMNIQPSILNAAPAS